jgi:hypothetical protein
MVMAISDAFMLPSFMKDNVEVVLEAIISGKYTAINDDIISQWHELHPDIESSATSFSVERSPESDNLSPLVAQTQQLEAPSKGMLPAYSASAAAVESLQHCASCGKQFLTDASAHANATHCCFSCAPTPPPQPSTPSSLCDPPCQSADPMLDAHTAIHLFDGTSTTKADLSRAAVKMLVELSREGNAQAMGVCNIISGPGEHTFVHFNVLDAMFFVKFIHMALGLALHSVNSFHTKKRVEYASVLESIHGIMNRSRPLNKSEHHEKLNRALNTYKTRTLKAAGVQLFMKPSLGVKLGEEWVNATSVWRWTRDNNKSAKESPFARAWVLKAWAQLTGKEEMEPALKCIGAWQPPPSQ